MRPEQLWPARTVVVDKSFTARCTFCEEWPGGTYHTWAEANDDRQGHLDWHRAQPVPQQWTNLINAGANPDEIETAKLLRKQP